MSSVDQWPAAGRDAVAAARSNIVVVAEKQ
jgi:hypothetical protein